MKLRMYAKSIWKNMPLMRKSSLTIVLLSVLGETMLMKSPTW